jgi:hypothetical protein
MSQLPLDNYKRDTFVRHLDSMGVPELMGREPTPNAGCGRSASELPAS